MGHYNKQVTRTYLNRVKGVEETWGKPLSTYVRAIFCDSLELGESNRTHDILATFKQSKGYDISPYLPLVMTTNNQGLEMPEAFIDELRRARYDWIDHQVTSFLDNFTREYAAFCHDNKLLSRYQA